MLARSGGETVFSHTNRNSANSSDVERAARRLVSAGMLHTADLFKFGEVLCEESEDEDAAEWCCKVY